MDVERRESGVKDQEKRNFPQEHGGDLETKPTSLQTEGDIELAVAKRRQEAERASRATREMKDPLLVRVESLLSDGLADEYATLAKEKKEPFRKEGEVLAIWLQGAIARGAVKPHEVLTRLERWLLIIEGKDRHSPWLLQEAYVRARRVLKEMMYNQIGH